MFISHDPLFGDLEAQQAVAKEMINCACLLWAPTQSTYAQLAALHSERAGFSILKWGSLATFRKDYKKFPKKKQEKRGCQTPPLPITFYQYSDLGACTLAYPETYYSIPEPMPERFLNISRISLAPLSIKAAPAFIDVLVLVPMQHQPACTPSSSALLIPGISANVDAFLSLAKNNAGLERKRRGQCSTCGLASKLNLCGGCSLHAYLLQKLPADHVERAQAPLQASKERA